jgi:hypothetical protein
MWFNCGHEMKKFRTYEAGDLVAIDEIARALSWLSTNNDIDFAERIKIYRSMDKDAQSELGRELFLLWETAERTKNQYAINYAMHSIFALIPAIVMSESDEMELDESLRESPEEEWREAIIRAASDWKWLRFNSMTFAPLPAESDEAGLVNVNLIIEWLKESGLALHGRGLAKILEKTRFMHHDYVVTMPTHNELERIERDALAQSMAAPAIDAPKKTEAPEERRERIAKRKSDLIAAGVRNFLQVISEEEGFSKSRIKQILEKAEAQEKKDNHLGIDKPITSFDIREATKKYR